MTLPGWLFLCASLAFVWGLTLWCYGRVLARPADDQDRVDEDRAP